MRECDGCTQTIPRNGSYYKYDGREYCTLCLKEFEISQSIYHLKGEFIGTSENEEVEFVDGFFDNEEGTE